MNTRCILHIGRTFVYVGWPFGWDYWRNGRNGRRFLSGFRIAIAWGGQ